MRAEANTFQFRPRALNGLGPLPTRRGRFEIRNLAAILGGMTVALGVSLAITFPALSKNPASSPATAAVEGAGVRILDFRIRELSASPGCGRATALRRLDLTHIIHFGIAIGTANLYRLRGAVLLAAHAQRRRGGFFFDTEDLVALEQRQRQTGRQQNRRVFEDGPAAASSPRPDSSSTIPCRRPARSRCNYRQVNQRLDHQR